MRSTTLTGRVGPGGQIVATKHGVTSALGCERLHVTDRPFEWSVRNATRLGRPSSDRTDAQLAR